MNSTSIWRSRPVFITSTFRDMHAERDWLRTHVFPELEERLRERRHHLEPIDLRWGVDTAGVQDESGKEMQVLKVCLAEIERARPFQIVLLGERFGWVPPAERLAAAAREAGFDGDLAGQSITALEVAYGALAQTQRQRCYFYFRAPLERSALTPVQLAEYAEPHGSAAAQQLARLKQRIEQVLPQQVRHYDAQWDAAGGRISGLEDFGRQVLEDLWTVLDRETAAYAAAPTQSWQQLERFVLEQFIEERARGFLGRGAVLQDLAGFAAAGGGVPLASSRAVCIKAAPGAGKSALFAELVRRLGEENTLVLAHAAGISPLAGSVDRMLRRWVQELAHALAVDDRLAPDADAQEVERTFQRLLGQASVRRRVVLLIDALNQFEATAGAQHLLWLPKPWPDGAVLIATTLPGVQAEALARLPFAATLELAPLNEQEAADIARAICRRYHRALSEDVLHALLAKPASDGCPAAGNPLWLSMAVEELNLLDADDFSRAEREFRGSAEEKLFRLLREVASSLPADVEGLYDWLLERAAQLHGRAFVEASVALVAASRHGWRERDFRELVARISNESWDDLRFAALRRTLRSHLVARGAFAQWDVHHAQFRQAILRRYPVDTAARRDLHRTIARYLLDLPRADPLHESETMVHLMGADESSAAVQYYGGDMTDGEEGGATAALASALVAGDPHAADSALTWLTALPAVSAPTSQRSLYLCERLLFKLHDSLARAPLRVRHELLRSVNATLAALAARLPTDDVFQRALSMSCTRLGDILVDQGRLAEALGEYERGAAIAECLVAQDPGNAARQRDLWLSLTGLGQVAAAHGKRAEALSIYERSLALAEQMAAQDDAGVLSQRDLSLSYEHVGDMLAKHGRLDDALQAAEKRLAITDRLARGDANGAAWQGDLWVAHTMLGDILARQGRLVEAQHAYETGRSFAEQLVVRSGGLADRQRDLAASHSKVGTVAAAQGRVGDALRAGEAALAIRERLVAQEPDNARWRNDLALSCSQLAMLCDETQDADGSARYWQRCRDVLREMKRAGMQLRASSARLLHAFDAQQDRERASTLYQEGQLDAAYAVMEEIELQCRTVDDTDGLSWAVGGQGVVLQDWGRFEEALALYREQERLCRALAAPNPEWLATSLLNQGEVLALKLGRPHEGRPLAEEARRIALANELASLAGSIEAILQRIDGAARAN